MILFLSVKTKNLAALRYQMRKETNVLTKLKKKKKEFSVSHVPHRANLPQSNFHGFRAQQPCALTRSLATLACSSTTSPDCTANPPTPLGRHRVPTKQMNEMASESRWYTRNPTDITVQSRRSSVIQSF